MLTAERVDIIGLIEDLPPFSHCTREVLEEYLAYDAMRACGGPNEVLCGLEWDHNLYVLLTGEAVLRVGRDIRIQLEPGDYFGQHGQRYHSMAGTVTSVTDVEVLVVGAQDLLRLELASSESRHPSRFEARLDFAGFGGRQRRLFHRGR